MKECPSEEMVNAALELLDMGFSILPVKRSDKRPYIKWEKYQKSHPTDDDIIRWWNSWPHANIAIICGKISGIFCVDADGPKGIEWMNTHLPKTGVYSITKKGIHAIYKIPKDSVIRNSVRLAPEVDIRGEGGYFVAPPSIHETGHQYRWQFLMDGWDDLAEYVPPNGGGNLNVDLSTISAKLDTDKVSTGISKGERNVILFKEACRLRGKNLTEDEIWLLLKSFADRCDPPYPESELLPTFKSALKYEPDEAQIVISDETVEPEVCQYENNDVPCEVLNPGGLLQELIDYIEINSTVSVPFFSLAAAVTLLGNVAGQKIQTETGLRTNIYSIALGYSGAGKNAPFSTFPQLLSRTAAARTIGPTELTSSTAILRWLSQPGSEVTFMMLDEIGLVLKGLKKPDSAASDIPRLFIKLFSATDRPEIKNYANGDAIRVNWHHLAMYGASTPERFWESLTGGEVADGFLARVLIWESHHDAPFPKSVISFHSSPSIEKQISDIFQIETKMDTANGNLSAIPVPKIISRTNEAQEMFETWARGYHSLKNRHKTVGDGISSIYGRAAEHAAKMALIHALSKCGVGVKKVDTDSIEWACKTVDYLITNTIIQIQENVADNEIVRWKQKIVKGIRKGMQRNITNTISQRELMQRECRGLTSKDLNQYLKDLISTGEIGAKEETAKNGRKIISYFVAKIV